MMMGKLWERVKRESRAKEDSERERESVVGKRIKKMREEEEEEEASKWATRESHIWRHYKNE